MLESRLHIISSSGLPVKEYEACNQQGIGTMEGEEARENCQGPLVFGRRKGSCQIHRKVIKSKKEKILQLRPPRFEVIQLSQVWLFFSLKYWLENAVKGISKHLKSKFSLVGGMPQDPPGKLAPLVPGK